MIADEPQEAQHWQGRREPGGQDVDGQQLCDRLLAGARQAAEIHEVREQGDEAAKELRGIGAAAGEVTLQAAIGPKAVQGEWGVVERQGGVVEKWRVGGGQWTRLSW